MNTWKQIRGYGSVLQFMLSQTVAIECSSKCMDSSIYFQFFHNNSLDDRDLRLDCPKFDTYRTVFKWSNLEGVSKEIQLPMSSGSCKI